MKSVFFYFCNRAGYIDDKLSNLKVCIMHIPSPEGSESLHPLRGQNLTVLGQPFSFFAFDRAGAEAEAWC